MKNIPEDGLTGINSDVSRAMPHADWSLDLKSLPGSHKAGNRHGREQVGAGGFLRGVRDAALIAGLAGIPLGEAAAQSAGFLPAAPVTALRQSSANVLCRTDDGREFVVERQGGTARLKFADSEEVLALRIVPGPRGDELFKTDTDEVVLRLTALGGITLYTAQNPNGSPAIEQSGAEAIEPPARPAAGLQAAFDRFTVELARAGAALKLHVSPEASAFPAETADAALVAALGVKSVPTANLTSLRIERGRIPGAQVQGKALIIQVVPELGYAGRPSAAAVRQAIEAQGAGDQAKSVSAK